MTNETPSSSFSRSGRTLAGEFQHPPDEFLSGFRPQPASIGQRESAEVKQTRMVKIGESLSDSYDLSAALPNDKANVAGWIRVAVTISDSAPELGFKLEKHAGFYSAIFRGFDEPLDGDVLHYRLRGDPDNKYEGLLKYFFNPKAGLLILRIGMLDPSAPVERKPGSTKRSRTGE